MTDDRNEIEDRDGLAGEYALGLLTGDELGRARSLMASDPAFRAEVARWLERLAPLLDEVAPVKPPAAAWRQIAEQTGADEPANVVVLRRKLFVWRTVSGGLTALAASLGIVLLMHNAAPPTPAPTAGAPMVARLAEDGQVALVANWDPARRQLVVAAAAGLAQQANRSHELWIIPAGGKPRSLGVVPGVDAAVVRLSPETGALMQAGGTIAVSVEPLGGSPTGSPTGPVVASGPLKAA